MNYRVFVNKTEIKVNSARVSAYPINRVWWGVQRELSQTEIAYFAGFDLDAPSEIEVEVSDVDVVNVELRPLAKKLPFTRQRNRIFFTLSEPVSLTVEINGYHEALAIFADPPFVYEPKENDIHFLAGVHNAGLIVPENGQRIIIDRGACVYGVIYAKDVDNVEILGRGILDSSIYRRNNDSNGADGHEVTQALRKLDITERDVHYAGSFTAYNCKNLVVDGITFVDSPLWTVIVRNGCENVLINNIKIIGQWRYNSDGVDICASKNVALQNSFIRAFDDCVVVRAPHLDGETGGCTDITVRNNTLWCDWGKNLEIWSGHIKSEIRNVFFENNYLIHVQMIAASIDTWYGCDRILVENIRYDGVFAEHDKDHKPQQYQDSDDRCYDLSAASDLSDIKLVSVKVGRLGKDLGNQQFDTNVDTTGFDIRYRNISFDNIKFTTDIPNPIYISSEKLSELSGVTIDGFDYKEYMKHEED